MRGQRKTTIENNVAVSTFVLSEMSSTDEGEWRCSLGDGEYSNLADIATSLTATNLIMLGQ